MKTQFKAPKMSYKFRLVKLDGDVKEHIADPSKDPRCDEIREWTLGNPNTIIYKRGE